MPRTSSSKTASKRKRASPRTTAGVAKKTTAAKHKALRAAKADPVLTQELKDASVRTAVPAVQTLPFVPVVELLGLMSRAASTSLSLPFAMMRCRTPFEMWGAQSKFLQGIFADFQKISARAMNSAFNGVAEEARDTKVKRRRQTVAS
jgi:hypothetical protein